MMKKDSGLWKADSGWMDGGQKIDDTGYWKMIKDDRGWRTMGEGLMMEVHDGLWRIVMEDGES
jgi:hypothetical protein